MQVDPERAGGRLNFSKGAGSIRISPPGATLNMGYSAPATIGLPGTGLSYCHALAGTGQGQGGGPGAPAPAAQAVGVFRFLAILIGLLALIGCGRSVQPPETVPGNGTTGLPGATRTVTAQRANCRARPNPTAPVVATLGRGTSVEIIARNEGWSQIRREGSPCWIADRLLSANAGPQVVGRREDVPVGAGRASGIAPVVGPSAQPAARRVRRDVRGANRPRHRAGGFGGGCPCSGGRVCIGPRGGRYCITSGGNRRYGV